MITKEQEQQIIQVLSATQPLRIGIFGSFARGEANGLSDIDILFSPQVAIGYFGLAAMKKSLEQMLDCRVDLLTEGGLSQFIAQKVHRDLKIIYEA